MTLTIADPTRPYIGTSALRTLNSRDLRALDREVFILGRKDELPLAALVPYDTYLLWQEALRIWNEVRAGSIPRAAAGSCIARSATPRWTVRCHRRARGCSSTSGRRIALKNCSLS